MSACPYVITTHVTCSINFWVVVSLEHLSAVTHPRTIWIHSERAVDATIITAVMDVARFMMCDRLSRISGSGVSVSCTCIMAGALVKKSANFSEPS